ncbi:TPA: hypothetical protein DEO28_00080 [Candidatus Dependentiae bacterium]|nr:MAG: hypothetical protein UR14_C0001G0126 [candidate division TM6 bacterium GW2011_GWE2_31_21]KKP53994.1 MAG: hypothetical protein UR43_C0001G0012 [candidate division TM6 bacterium GW2011_GWF2_33_332]HBS48425.1 hypothetical protein [Candidatus Dependentiae bacterium]HBZ72901.1 hypothetical protein [Candidatus Dependentiae bacterium]
MKKLILLLSIIFTLFFLNKSTIKAQDNQENNIEDISFEDLTPNFKSENLQEKSFLAKIYDQIKASPTYAKILWKLSKSELNIDPSKELTVTEKAKIAFKMLQLISHETNEQVSPLASAASQHVTNNKGKYLTGAGTSILALALIYFKSDLFELSKLK